MAGDETNTKIKLNNTLLFIITILINNNIHDWFLGYGTLLGIIRENSCIENDDDIDIITNNKNYNKIKELLEKNGFVLEYEYGIKDSKNILKTQSSIEYSSVDFYMATVDDLGNFKDTWECVTWSNCYIKSNDLIKYIWNNHLVYLPNNFETKLINRYGPDWKIPANTKGPKPRRTII
jgi:hypothetical protein